MKITTKIDLPYSEVIEAIKIHLYDQGIEFEKDAEFSIEHFEDSSVVVTIVDGD